MQKNIWPLVAILGLGLLVLFLALRGPSPSSSGTSSDGQLVMTYAVPPERGEAIRDALRVVLLTTREGVQPQGHASLPMPGMLVVAAPASMQPSIRTAVEELSKGAVADEIPESTVSFDLWVLAASDEPAQEDDPALRSLGPLLAQIRNEFGFGALQLVDRGMATVSRNSRHPDRTFALMQTPQMTSSVHLFSITDTRVEAVLEFRMTEVVDRARQDMRFESSFSLPHNQWMVVGLLGGSGDRPERLLLMRQRILAPNP